MSSTSHVSRVVRLIAIVGSIHVGAKRIQTSGYASGTYTTWLLGSLD